MELDSEHDSTKKATPPGARRMVPRGRWSIEDHPDTMKRLQRATETLLATLEGGGEEEDDEDDDDL